MALSFKEHVANLELKLQEIGAIQKGHFILTSGRHTDIYVEKFRLLEQPELLKEAVRLMLADVSDTNGDFDLVIGPTTGGILVAYEAASQLGVPAIYAEREEGKRVLRRGMTIPSDSKVLIVDDVLTTGLSVQEVFDLVQSYGAFPEMIGTLIDRSETNAKLPTFRGSAIRMFSKTYAPDEIPDWLQAIPPIKPGTR